MNQTILKACACLFLFCSLAFGQLLDEAQAPPEIRVLLGQLRQTIEKEKLNFKVGYTPALKYTLTQLCGLRESKAANWWQQAATKNLFKLKPATLRLGAPVVSLPSSWDWRAHNGVTPIKDQGGCGSCWAFGCIGAMESWLAIKSNTFVDLAEQHLVSCNNQGYGCNGGWWVFEMLINPGAVLESAFPYVASDVPCGGPYSYPHKLTGWAFVDGEDKVADTNKIKQAIYDYGPVAAAVYVGNAFQAYSSGVFDKNETSGGGWFSCNGNSNDVNHAIILVGWDDSKGAWILRNSWGTGWGENGYMYIKYGINNVGFAAASVY